MAALAAPIAATALPSGGGNSIWWISDAALKNDLRTAQVTVGYQCETGAEATITVRLYQDDRRQGEVTVPATCIGWALTEKVQIDSIGEPWEYGRSSATMGITDNAGDRDAVFTIKMVKSIHP